MTAAAVARQDLVKGFTSVRAWTALAWDDLLARYARTVIGPCWMTIAHAFFVFGYAYWSSVILGHPMADHLPYIAAGLTVWIWISTSLVEAGNVYVRASALVTAYDLPLSLQVHRAVAGQFLAMCHNMLVFVAVLAMVQAAPGWTILLAVPGIVVVYAAAVGWTLILGLLGTRYRDVAPLITSVVGMLFILTPIFWRRSDVATAPWLADWNPFFHLIEVVRAPLLGLMPSATNWIVATCMAAVLLGAGAFSFMANRARLSYWF
jgi:lipopolysaccharide transport system permease protein